jgi:hypothetical protein
MSQAASPERISRVQAFSDQGVALSYPPRSWSGVRAHDGGVVIAIREGEIQCAFEGFRCLLWSPVIDGATEWVDRPIKHERLSHCRIAATYGGADALVVSGAAGEVERGKVFPLRVEKVGAEYWAFWGAASCPQGIDELIEHPAYASIEPSRLAA